MKRTRGTKEHRKKRSAVTCRSHTGRCPEALTALRPPGTAQQGALRGRTEVFQSPPGAQLARERTNQTPHTRPRRPEGWAAAYLGLHGYSCSTVTDDGALGLQSRTWSSPQFLQSSSLQLLLSSPTLPVKHTCRMCFYF